MKVLVFETNLMWSSKLVQSLKALGHEAVLMRVLPSAADGAGAGIVNLGQPVPDPVDLIATLRRLGVRSIAHAGHKESNLLQVGREAGADLLVTNSELTNKIGELLKSLESEVVQ